MAPPLKPVRENPFLLLLASGVCQQSLVVLGHLDALPQSRSPFVFLSLCLFFFEGPLSYLTKVSPYSSTTSS